MHRRAHTFAVSVSWPEFVFAQLLFESYNIRLVTLIVASVCMLSCHQPHEVKHTGQGGASHPDVQCMGGL